jgi:hypothetical protein
VPARDKRNAEAEDLYWGKSAEPTKRKSGASDAAGFEGKAKPGEPEKPKYQFTAEDLHQAWKDTSKVEGDPKAVREMRDLIISIMEKRLPAGDLAAFRKANNEYGITSDLRRIYSGSFGEGKGTLSGKLSSDALIKGAGRHPMSKDTDEAAQLFNKFSVDDPMAEHLRGDSGWSMLRGAGATTAGKWANKASEWGQNAFGDVRSPEGKKRMVEMLRAAIERGAPAANTRGNQ